MINTHTNNLESFEQLDFNFQSQIVYWLTAHVFLEVYYLPMRALAVLDKIGPPKYSLFFSYLLIWYLGKGVLVHDVSTTLNVKLLTFAGICNTTQYVIWKPR